MIFRNYCPQIKMPFWGVQLWCFLHLINGYYEEKDVPSLKKTLNHFPAFLQTR